MAENRQGVAVLPRDGYPVGVPCWIDTSQRDLDAARDFYGGLFGWEFQEWPSGTYLVATIDGLDLTRTLVPVAPDAPVADVGDLGGAHGAQKRASGARRPSFHRLIAYFFCIRLRHVT